VRANKNDARDAEAICEAVSQPSMRFVAVKTLEERELLAMHRARQGFVGARTAQANQMRGSTERVRSGDPEGDHVP
jgi:transposase